MLMIKLFIPAITPTCSSIMPMIESIQPALAAQPGMDTDQGALLMDLMLDLAELSLDKLTGTHPDAYSYFNPVWL